MVDGSVVEPWWKRFWISHALVPALLWIAGAIAFECADLDLWASDLCYDFDLGRWRWRSVSWIRTWGHDRAKALPVGIGLVCAVAFALSFRWSGVRRLRYPAAYVVLCLCATSLTIAWLKQVTNRPYPIDFERYGGSLPYFGLFDARPVGQRPRLGFPAAHSGSAFALFALYFAARWLKAPRPALWLLPAVALGLAFGAVQQVRGQHFLSHNWWSAGIAWAWAVSLFTVFRSRRQASPEQ